jgi:hypothetical protein
LDEILKMSRMEMLDNLSNTKFMAKYGGVINSLPLDHLSFHRLMNASQPTEKGRTTLASFFKKQAPYLISINFHEMDFVFDPMRMLLRNLESVQIRETICRTDLNVLRFNDLKVLPKLKCLKLEISDESSRFRSEEYNLNVGELATLKELKVTIVLSWGTDKTVPEFCVVVPAQPLDGMESLHVSGADLGFSALEQIVQTMPNLKKLKIDDPVVSKRLNFRTFQ